MSKIYIYGIVIAVIVSGFFGGKYILEEKVRLETELGYVKAEKNSVIDGFNTYANNIQTEAIEQNRKLSELRTKFEDARTQQVINGDVFNGHDFDALTRAKPGLMSKRGNVSYSRMFRDTEAFFNTVRSSTATGESETTPSR